MVEISRLGNLLEDRKEKLKREMKRKRAILEELMLQELRAEFEVKQAAEGEEIIRMDTVEESDDALLQVLYGIVIKDFLLCKGVEQHPELLFLR